MKLVIFSYPLHFNIMQLAYRNAIKVIDDIDEVVVVWDNGEQFWTNDLPVYEDSKIVDGILKAIPASRVVLHSEIESTHDECHGWLRQQYVKLSLHKLFDDPQYIILDSDTILKQKKDFYVNGHVMCYNDPFDNYQPYFDFIKHVFNLEKENSPSYMTHYALFERSVLESIEEYCLSHHNQDLITLFKKFYRPLMFTTYKIPMCPPLSEFEIYGLFCERILNRPLIPSMVNTASAGPNTFINLYNENFDIFFEATDDQIPDEFWKDQNVTIYKNL